MWRCVCGCAVDVDVVVVRVGGGVCVGGGDGVCEWFVMVLVSPQRLCVCPASFTYIGPIDGVARVHGTFCFGQHVRHRLGFPGWRDNYIERELSGLRYASRHSKCPRTQVVCLNWPVGWHV